MLRTASLIAVVLAGVATAPAAAQVGLGTATSATAELTNSRTSSVADLALRVTGTPPPAGTRLAPALRQIVELPKGSRLRVTALPQCAAARAEIDARGADAVCPPASRVGQGLAVGTLDGTTEVRLELAVHAVPGGLLFSAGTQSFRATSSGRRLTFDVPTLDGRLSPKLFVATLHRVVRTPPTCPKHARWRSTTSFQALTALNGAPTGPIQAIASKSFCRA